jgi:hypothetical protein
MGVCRIWVFAKYSISWLDFVGMPMDRLKFVELQDMHVFPIGTTAAGGTVQ